MTRPLVLSDDLLRRALTPGRDVQAPSGLLEDVADRIRRAPQRAGFLARLGEAASPWSPRLRWSLVVAGAVLALVVGLLLAAGAPEPLPAFRDITFDNPLALRIAVSGPDEAWVASFDGGLWHRTAGGWSGPEPIGVADVRGIAALPDGRLMVTSDHGTWARDAAGGWTKLDDQPSDGIVAAADGTVWVTGLTSSYDHVIDAYRAGPAGWERTRATCPAGGGDLAIGAAGSVWSAGITYSGTGGLAHLEGSRCVEVFPPTSDVVGLGASPSGAVAVTLAWPVAADQTFRSETMLLAGTSWTQIRSDDYGIPWRLAFGPADELYAGLLDGIWRYRDGTWTRVIPDASYQHLELTPDGTLWYVTEDADGIATLRRVAIEDLPG